jgi:hypothetical protein
MLVHTDFASVSDADADAVTQLSFMFVIFS